MLAALLEEVGGVGVAIEGGAAGEIVIADDLVGAMPVEEGGIDIGAIFVIADDAAAAVEVGVGLRGNGPNITNRGWDATKCFGNCACGLLCWRLSRWTLRFGWLRRGGWFDCGGGVRAWGCGWGQNRD